MNRGRISISVFLCFLMMMLLVVIGCSSSSDAPAPEATYTVTFDSQSATAAASPTSKTVTSPATTVVTLPTPPTKTNYYFAGWWTAATSGGTEFTASTTVTASITVYARWSTSPVYTVTYDSQGGSAVGAQHVTSPATTVVTLPAAPTKTGYIFGGWYTATSGGGTAFIATTEVTADITVYAKWNSYTYTVTFNSQSATVEASPTSKTVTSPATTVDALPTAPTKTGSTFAGWYTATSGGGTEFTATTTVTANITVYAKWSTNSVYTVTYDSQGGSAVDAQHVTLPATTVGTLPTAPTKTNYTFDGWYTATSGGGTQFTASTTVAASLTVYAKWTAIPGAFTQDDLTGPWAFNMVKTGQHGDGTSANDWVRGRLSIDGSGNVSCVSMSNSTNATGCPASIDWKMTINSSGVISETGADAADSGHMTMTSNKNFIAGTGSGGSSYQLATMQKVVTGTSYSAADVQSKSFVYHALWVGSTNGSSAWIYGAGTTDTGGNTTISSQTNSWGSNSQINELRGTFVVDGNGNVTLLGNSFFHGFMSDDKKTIVAAYGGDGSVAYYIIQFTGTEFTAGPLPVGISAAHMLAVGSTPAPFWLHFTSTVASGGVMSFSNSVSSNSGVAAPGTTLTGHISASGTVTVAEDPSFHGQVSDDGKFTVATQTITSGAYALQVTTQ